jgi:uncharacterized membrane protein
MLAARVGAGDPACDDATCARTVDQGAKAVNEFGFGFFDWFMPLMAATLLIPLVITGLIVGLVVWAIRRNSAPREDPAVAELKGRLARGEIDTAEYEVRLRSLIRDRG